MNVRQRDIVLLPVPFSDQSSSKVRPAIVISNNSINTGEDIILVPLTSVLKDAPYSVDISQKDLAEGKLLVPSRARIDKVFTAHKSLIAMKIGAVKAEILEEISKELIQIV